MSPARITNTAHQWVGAATLLLDDKQASWAARRLSVTVGGDTEVPVLEVYCGNCRKPWDDVRWQPCEAADGNDHLRGGKSGRNRARHEDEDEPPAHRHARGA